MRIALRKGYENNEACAEVSSRERVSDDMEKNKQESQWEEFYLRIARTLRNFGTENIFGKADYLIVDDNYGWRRHTVEIHKLHMLMPSVIRALQGLLSDFDGWEIVVAVDVPGREALWPPMGLTIRSHAIDDDLRRSFLPKEYQNITYK